MKIISFSSIKGGTGKSSLCILTANYAASAGYRVLVADLDLQNSLSSYYLDSPDPAEQHNIAVALHSERLAKNIIPTTCRGVDLLASSLDLVKLRAIGEHTLRRILATSSLPYDFLFIDTAPTFDNLVLNAYHAADLILTPVSFSQFDLKSARFLHSMIYRETDKIHAWHLLFNFYKQSRSDNPDTLRNQYETLFRDTFGDTILPNTIPESSLIRRSIDTGEKITTAAAKAPLYEAITALADYCGIHHHAERF